MWRIGAMKWMVCFSLMAIGSQSAANSDITVSVLTVTSRSVTVRWSKYPGTSSYKITVTPKISPSNPIAYTQFSANSVMGSVNSLSPNTMYIIEVEAMDSSFTVLSFATVEHTTAPAVPTVSMVTSTQSESVTVEFAEVPGATSYILRAENADGFFSESPVSGSPGTVLNLQPYTDYSLSVLSVNSGGRSQPSLTVEAKTAVAALKLNSIAPGNNTIIVAWDPVAQSVLYTLSIIRNGSDNEVKLNTTDTTVTFSDLEVGTYYCIKGFAWDIDARRGDDFTVCQITRSATPDSVYLSVVSSPVAGLSVSWAVVQGATEYRAVSSLGLNCSSTSSSCVIAPMKCGRRHTITVTAINQAGPSPPSALKEFVTFPCAPERLWVEETTAGNCSVKWNSMPYANSYVASVKSDGSQESCNTTGTSCDYTCQCGHTYLMTVFAFNQAGSSPPGPVLNYTTLPCCPENVYIHLASADTLEITWSASRGAELYETRAVDGSEVILCNDTAPVCALSDLTCDSPYNVVVSPCNDVRGCNRNCTSFTKYTAPCMPEVQNVAQTNATSINVTWSASKRDAVFTVSLMGASDSYSCQSRETSCQISQLPCGSIYDVSVVASTLSGQSLPSYTVPLETAPCCPVTINVDQVTQAMTNVTWSLARGAQSFVTSLTSSRGNARCHTQDSHCLMGCITCGTNYTVSMNAISRTGHKSECTYRGFSSSACCPSGVRLYMMANNTVRLYWRSSGPIYNYTANVFGSVSNFTCSPPPGANTCDISGIACGDDYSVVVSPLTLEGTTVAFCPKRIYSVSCSGSGAGMLIYRGKRSVD